MRCKLQVVSHPHFFSFQTALFVSPPKEERDYRQPFSSRNIAVPAPFPSERNFLFTYHFKGGERMERGVRERGVGLAPLS